MKNLTTSRFAAITRIIVLTTIVSAISAFSLSAQSIPTPAPAQTKPIFLVGATVHVGNGTVIENGIVGFSGGKLTLVGKADAAFDRTGADVIDVKGKHIYPGFIATNTTLGLVEIEAVRSTNDDEEVGSLNPHVRSLIAYNAESVIIPTVRFNGVLVAMVAPRGGLVSGRSSIMELDAWNWEDATMKADIGVHVNFPTLTRQPGAQEADRKTQDEAITKQIAALYQFFREAQSYAKSPTPKETNARFEAMRGLFDGSKKLFIRADHAKSILAAVNFAKDFGIMPVIVGGTDSWLVADVLKANNVPVMLEGLHALPTRWSDDIEQPYKTPAALQKAGVLFSIGSIPTAWQQRNLGFQAGTAAAHGLSKEEALSAITLNTATILGIAQRVGSLETGKDATLFVSDGDALDMRGNTVEHAFIRGKKLQLVNKQKFLYEQYKAKYGQK